MTTDHFQGCGDSLRPFPIDFLTMLRAIRFGALFSFVLSISACAGSDNDASDTVGDSAATADTAQWQSLTALSNWRGYRTQDAPVGWTANDSILSTPGRGQDIVSRAEYTDFELEFDWMLTPGGNSGVFYRATEEYDKVYWSAPEYALLDNAGHPDGKNPLTTAAAAHSLYAPPEGVVRPAGEWNATRIVVKGTHVEHWLNGQKVVEYDYVTPDFLERVAKSKFAEWPNFAKSPKGFLSIQGDHDGQLSIRNMRIREFR